MPKPYTVELTPMECKLAALLGAERMIASMISKAKQSIGHGERDDLWGSNIYGAHSELATAKFLNCCWTPTINEFKKADLADFIQVRSRRFAKYELYLREEDPRHHAYILVHYEHYPRFVIMGWRWGYEIEQFGRWDNPGGYRFAHFLPHDQLRDFDEFPWEQLWGWESKDVCGMRKASQGTSGRGLVSFQEK
jgi:hypothetical protein